MRILSSLASKSSRTNAIRGMVLAALVAIFALFLWDWQLDDSLKRVLSVAADNPNWAFVIVVAMMIAHNVVPIPAEAIAMAAGAVLGPVIGSVAVWIGAMLGACFAFWIARRWGRGLVARLLPDKYTARLDQISDNTAWPALLGVRLIPIISFNLVNYSVGLTSVPWRVFLWTTAIGIIPVLVMSVGIGANLDIIPMEYLLGALGVIIVIKYIRPRRA